MTALFDDLMQAAEAAFTEDDFERAAQLYAEAAETARDAGDQDAADRAFCNQCSVLIELDRGADQIPKLKEILLRSDNTRNRFHAAYCTAVAYDLSGDIDRASGYADRASAFADELGDPVSASRSHNLFGNLSTRASKYADAERAFSRSLDAHHGLDGHHRMTEAQVRDNLGYVMMCTDRLDQGIELCEQARAELERLGADHYLY